MITFMKGKKLFVGTGIFLLVIAAILLIFGFVAISSLLGFVIFLCGIFVFLIGIELVIHPNLEDFLQVVFGIIYFFSFGPWVNPPYPAKKKDDKD